MSDIDYSLEDPIESLSCCSDHDAFGTKFVISLGELFSVVVRLRGRAVAKCQTLHSAFESDKRRRPIEQRTEK